MGDINKWVMKKNIPTLTALVFMASIFSCKTPKNIDSNRNVANDSRYEELFRKADSSFSALYANQNRMTEKLSNLKIENKTTYYTLPDSLGKQHTTKIVETVVNKEDKEVSKEISELRNIVERQSKQIDSLTNTIKSTVQEQSKVKEVSWISLHWWKIVLCLVFAFEVVRLIKK